MQKTILFILTALLLAVGGCRNNVTRPAVPNATTQPAATDAAHPTDAPQSDTTSRPDSTDTPAVTEKPDASASAEPNVQEPDTSAPVRDASYREYEVTYPSRGVQVHATVVLPGSTSIGKSDNAASIAAPNVTGAASANPSAAPTADAASSAAPTASTQPTDAAKTDAASTAATADAGMNARTAEASATPEPEMHIYDASATPEMHAYDEPMPISETVTEQPAGGWPLVVFLHSYEGERNEKGGFATLAHKFAERGIASIRMDMAGSGDSEEPFTENHLTSMYTDALAAIEFAKATYPIDENEIGVFGFDMGGRVALHMLAQELFDFRAAVLLAPSNANEDTITMFGGQETWEKNKADAELNNYTTVTSPLGTVRDIAMQWFTDLEMNDDPATHIGKDRGDRTLVIWAQNDTTVRPDASKAVAEALGAETLVLETGGHSYGFYAENEELSERVANAAADFFDRTLRQTETGNER